MDAKTARETLHGWIDDANDALVVGLVELLGQFRAVIERQIEQQLATRGVPPDNRPRALEESREMDEAEAEETDL